MSRCCVAMNNDFINCNIYIWIITICCNLVLDKHRAMVGLIFIYLPLLGFFLGACSLAKEAFVNHSISFVPVVNNFLARPFGFFVQPDCLAFLILYENWEVPQWSKHINLGERVYGYYNSLWYKSDFHLEIYTIVYR